MKRPAAQPARGQQKKSKVEACTSGSKSTDDSGSSSSDSESKSANSKKAWLVVCVVRVIFIGCLLFVVDLFPGVA